MIPFMEVRVGLEKRQDGGADISILMSEHTFEHAIRETAAKRGLSTENMIIEALRLVQLFAQGELFIRDKGTIRQLISM